MTNRATAPPPHRTNIRQTIEKLRRMSEDTSSPREAAIAQRRLRYFEQSVISSIPIRSYKRLPRWYRYLLNSLAHHCTLRILSHSAGTLQVSGTRYSAALFLRGVAPAVWHVEQNSGAKRDTIRSSAEEKLAEVEKMHDDAWKILDLHDDA